MYRFKKILCVAEPTDRHALVLARAVELASRHDAELTVIDVIEPPPRGADEFGEQWSEAAVRARRAQLLTSDLQPFAATRPIDTRTVTGIPFLCVIQEVLRGGHDLVVSRCENPSWLDRVLGSDDIQLLRECPCPVWLLDPEASVPCRRILVAVDLDRQYPAHELATRHSLNCRLLEHACSLAIAESAELHVAHAWQVPSSLKAYPSVPAALLDEYGRTVHAQHARALADLLREVGSSLDPDALDRIERRDHLLEGSAKKVLPALARQLDADLIVMGSVARTGVPGLVTGNTAEMILSQLERSVLVIKPPGFVTPVTLEKG